MGPHSLVYNLAMLKIARVKDMRVLSDYLARDTCCFILEFAMSEAYTFTHY